MIAIYPVRPGDNNNELRYSIRSLTNTPQITQVWTVGYRPQWLHPDHHIDGNHHHTSQANVYNNIRLACEQTTNNLVAIFNDDFYITEPVEHIPTMYRSTLTEHLHQPRVQLLTDRWWPTTLNTTRVCLHTQGIPNPLSYELHTPFTCNPQLMHQVLTQFQHVTPHNPPQWRSLYGNLHNIGGQQQQDCKAYGTGPIHKPFHSTTDESFRHYETQLNQLFPNPSRWEQEHT